MFKFGDGTFLDPKVFQSEEHDNELLSDKSYLLNGSILFLDNITEVDPVKFVFIDKRHDGVPFRESHVREASEDETPDFELVFSDVNVDSNQPFEVIGKFKAKDISPVEILYSNDQIDRMFDNIEDEVKDYVDFNATLVAPTSPYGKTIADVPTLDYFRRGKSNRLNRGYDSTLKNNKDIAVFFRFPDSKYQYNIVRATINPPKYRYWVQF